MHVSKCPRTRSSRKRDKYATQDLSMVRKTAPKSLVYSVISIIPTAYDVSVSKWRPRLRTDGQLKLPGDPIHEKQKNHTGPDSIPSGVVKLIFK